MTTASERGEDAPQDEHPRQIQIGKAACWGCASFIVNAQICWLACLIVSLGLCIRARVGEQPFAIAEVGSSSLWCWIQQNKSCTGKPRRRNSAVTVNQPEVALLLYIFPRGFLLERMA